MPHAAALKFLHQQGMHPDGLNPRREVLRFLDEMSRGLAGRPSSLAMIPTYLGEPKGPLPRKKVTVIDAGGTNFRVALVEPGDAGITVIEQNNFTMPALDRELSAEAFFDTMAGYVAPLAGHGESLGFCFSYPVQMEPSGDGRLIHWTKEVKAPEVVGRLIGEGLLVALGRKGVKSVKRALLLNDTVATALAGTFGGDGRPYETYVGFILGTGTNTCYFENTSRLKSVGSLSSLPRMAVNVESGGYARMTRGRLDRAFDAGLTNPGAHVFEKMISGAYLGPLTLSVLKAAAGAGVFSVEGAGRLASVAGLETKDLGSVLATPHLGEGILSGLGEDDALAVWTVVDALVERAGLLTAVNLASAVLQSGGGMDPRRPVGIVAEGSTYQKLPTLRFRAERHLTGLLSGKWQRYWQVITLDRATLTGSAAAGLMG